MINVKIDNETALDMLIERLKVWTNDHETIALFEKMYENLIENGCFDGCEFDPLVIVDNDFINYYKVIDETDENFEKIKKLFLENGACDISCENVCYSYIESVNDDDEPTMILVRC